MFNKNTYSFASFLIFVVLAAALSACPNTELIAENSSSSLEKNAKDFANINTTPHNNSHDNRKNRNKNNQTHSPGQGLDKNIELNQRQQNVEVYQAVIEGGVGKNQDLLPAGRQVHLKALVKSLTGHFVAAQSCVWQELDGTVRENSRCIHSFEVPKLPSSECFGPDLPIKVAVTFLQDGHTTVRPAQKTFRVANTWCRFSVEDKTGLSSNQLTKIALQINGNGQGIWVGTADKGLAWLKEEKSKRWRPYYGVNDTLTSSLMDDSLTALAAAPDGKIWVGSTGGVQWLSLGEGGQETWGGADASTQIEKTKETVLTGNNISSIAMWKPSLQGPEKTQAIVLNYEEPRGILTGGWEIALGRYLKRESLAISVFSEGGEPEAKFFLPTGITPPFSHYRLSSALPWGKNLLVGVDVIAGHYITEYVYPTPCLLIYKHVEKGTSKEPITEWADSSLWQPMEGINGNSRIIALASNPKHTDVWVGFEPKHNQDFTPPLLPSFWFDGGEGGLAVGRVDEPGGDLKKAQWTFFEGGLGNSQIRALAVDGQNRAWVATSASLKRAALNERGVKLDTIPYSINDNAYLAGLKDLVYRESDNTLWIATKTAGLLKLQIDLVDWPPPPRLDG